MDPNKPIIMKARDKNREIQITPNEICYCKAEGCYTKFYLKSGKSYIQCKNVKWVEKQLNNDIFFRCHYSFLVNLLEIKSIEIEKGLIYQELYQIPVSNRKLAELLYKCNSYIVEREILVF
jgi:two-component system, LytTR family, response regulator